MPWLRSGDNAATYPLLLAVGAGADADDRLLNETAGFVWRCASQSAGHLTDGLVDLGTAVLLGGSRTRLLLDVAVAAGLMTTVTVEGRPAYRLVEDPEFLHIRDKEAVLWERQRDRDRKDPELTSAVRLRDGDACRYCGNVVNFLDRKSGRAGTYDHHHPGQPASLETYVVACKSHNSAMRDGERMPMLAPPHTPYYSRKTLEFLEAHGRTPAPGSYRTDPVHDDPELTQGGHRRDSARPAPAEDPARRDQDPAASAATLTPQPATPGPAEDPARRDQDPAASAATLTPQPATPGDGSCSGDPWEAVLCEAGSGSDLAAGLDPPGGDGTGRVGPGRDGPGRVGSGALPPQGAGGGGPGRRRRSRGRRGRGGGRR